MINYRKLTVIILSFFLFLCPFKVFATGTATTGFSGNNSVYIGNNIEVTLYVGSVSGTTDNAGLAAFGGNLSYSTDKLELISSTSLAPFTVELVGTKFGGFGQNTINGQTNIVKLTFKAIGLGSANISYSGSSQPDSFASPVSISGCSKSINITEPPSSNNNLSGLSVSVGTINFNKNTTSYSLSVESDVTSVSINANSEDANAKINGTGSKSLNFGNNKFDIVVTAPSGDQKTYTINITRKDNRSSNNNLSSLKVNGGDLNPKFSKNTTKYTLSVPYSVSTLNVDAQTEDSKAKVSVSGTNLVAEETKDVTITVTAENGSKKTYTISVTRGKDPNKVLSDNNYLTYLNPSIGILSPVFNKDTTTYEIWLPYEVDKISFDYAVEDTKYAKIDFEGLDTLQPGVNNVYKIKVTAENDKERVYTINVKRAKNPNENSSSNTYLKSIKLKNGKLIGSFDKEVHEYFYTKKEGFKIESVVAEDENSAVSIVEEGSTIYLVVTSSNGEYGVYSLREKETDNKIYLLYLIFFIVGCIVGFILKILIPKLKKLKKIKVKEKKTKK